jgi:hypothetical protein
MMFLGHTRVLLLAAGFLQMQTPPPAPPPTPATTPVYGPSHVEDTSLHLSFDLPEGIQSRKDLADGANQKFEKKSPAGEPCVTLPLLAFDPKVVRRIYFYRYNGACFPEGITTEQLRTSARRALTSILHNSGRESMSSPIDYKLSGHAAAVMSGNVYSEANHGVLFGEMTCVAIEKDMACWAFISSTNAKATRLAALPVQFDGHAPEPIIPEDMSQLVALPTLTFHDDQRHIEFTYPGSFASAAPRAADIIAKKTEEASGTAKAALGCMNILLNADELEEDGHSNIFIFSFPVACVKAKPTKATLRDFIVGLSKGYAKLARTEMHEPVAYTLAGRDVFLIQGTLFPPAKPASYISASCTIAGTDFFCWQISSSSVEHLRSVVASPVAFDGGLGGPLVPAALFNLSAAATK